MKDVCHHLKQVQKKVMQEVRKEELSAAYAVEERRAMGKAGPGEEVVVTDEDDEWDQARRAPRVIPTNWVSH